MTEVARIYPHIPLLETTVQESLPRADGTRIAWEEPRRLLFRRIVRRDGSIVDFRRERIAESIRSALGASASSSHTEELTDRIIIFLANRFPDRLLTTAEVALSVETVLLRSGLAEPAKAYAERQGGVSPRVDGSDGNRWPWDRSRIVAALHRETDLDLSLAEEIAREVEQTIIHSRLNSVTASLVRELVNAALLEHGLDEVRRRHTRLGLPVHDVLVKYAESKANGDLAAYLGQEVLAQLTLTHLLPSRLVDLYREHRIYMHEISSTHLSRSRRGSLSEQIAKGDSPESVARRLIGLRSSVHHHISVVVDPGSLGNWGTEELLRLFRALSTPFSPIVTEFECPIVQKNDPAVQAILEAATTAGQESAMFPAMVQIVLKVSHPKAVPISKAEPCWRSGTLVIESDLPYSHEPDTIQSKFSVDLGWISETHRGDVIKVVEELSRICRLIAEYTSAVQQATELRQAALWKESAGWIPVQLGLFGVREAFEYTGASRWPGFVGMLKELQSRSFAGQRWLWFSESPGRSVRSWFGQKENPVPSCLSGSDGFLFDCSDRQEYWKELDMVRRFGSVSERALRSDFLEFMLNNRVFRRWGYASKVSWCSSCGRPLAAETALCAACPGARVINARRDGWYLRTEV